MTLLAFTDGLIERRGEALDVGLARLRQEVIADTNGPLDDLLTRLAESLVGRGADDDTVLLGVRLKESVAGGLEGDPAPTGLAAS